MKKKFEIQNVKCRGCETTILNGLLSIPGIQNIALDAPQHSIALTYKDESVLEAARKKLSQLGYPLEGDENTLLKKAASYVSCAIGKLNS